MVENPGRDKLSRRDVLKGAGVLVAAGALVHSGDHIIDAAKELLPETLSSIREGLLKLPQESPPVSIAQYDRVVEKISSFSTEPRTLMARIIGAEIIRTFNDRKGEPAEQYDRLNKILNTSEFWLAIYDSTTIRYYNSQYPLDDFINDGEATYTHASSVYFEVQNSLQDLEIQKSSPERKSDIDQEVLKKLIDATVESVAAKLSGKQSDAIGRVLSEDKEFFRSQLMEKFEQILGQY